jgi:hypothetical protein
MKKLSLSIFAFVLLSSLSSCGVGHAFVFNMNHNSTSVNLSQSNYKVVSKATGTSEVSYILIFGGLKKRQLYANAYSRMVENADLMSGSRALANVVTEEHLGGVPPFYFKRTITVSANVIEFTK